MGMILHQGYWGSKKLTLKLFQNKSYTGKGRIFSRVWIMFMWSEELQRLNLVCSQLVRVHVAFRSESGDFDFTI